MAKSQQSFNKKEKEKKRKKKAKEKLERREQRKLEKAENGANTFELSYVDENGNLTSTPPDPAKKIKIKAEDIVLGVPIKDDSLVEKVRKGRVKFFNDEKGYGFIIDVDTKDSIFVHMNNVNGDLRENDNVSFEIEMGPKGPNAVNVNHV